VQLNRPVLNSLFKLIQVDLYNETIERLCVDMIYCLIYRLNLFGFVAKELILVGNLKSYTVPVTSVLGFLHDFLHIIVVLRKITIN